MLDDDLNLDELRELLRQLHLKQADTERMIREVTQRIDATIADHTYDERRRMPRHRVTPE